MKIYSHLPNFLHRWRIMGFGPFMMRLHRILDCDRTPFLHTHPFWYISIILSGGYTEQVLRADGQIQVIVHTRGSVIFRKASTAHRILEVQPNCATLFLSWRVNEAWKLIRHPSVKMPVGYKNAPDGLHVFKDGFRKRQNGKWYALRPTPVDAELCNTLSIHQNLDLV